MQGAGTGRPRPTAGLRTHAWQDVFLCGSEAPGQGFFACVFSEARASLSLPWTAVPLYLGRYFSRHQVFFPAPGIFPCTSLLARGCLLERPSQLPMEKSFLLRRGRDAVVMEKGTPGTLLKGRRASLSVMGRAHISLPVPALFQIFRAIVLRLPLLPKAGHALPSARLAGRRPCFYLRRSAAAVNRRRCSSGAGGVLQHLPRECGAALRLLPPCRPLVRCLDWQCDRCCSLPGSRWAAQQEAALQAGPRPAAAAASRAGGRRCRGWGRGGCGAGGCCDEGAAACSAPASCPPARLLRSLLSPHRQPLHLLQQALKVVRVESFSTCRRCCRCWMRVRAGAGLRAGPRSAAAGLWF